MNNSLKEISEIILGSNSILISSHVNPDGDNIGSSMALYLALKKQFKNVYILWVDNIPKDYLFLPGIKDIVKYEDITDLQDYTFISLDSADSYRLGINESIALNANNLINIDHHISNPMYGDYNYVDSKASATGEIVFQLIKILDIPMDSEISKCIYTAISSDTGSFMYSNVTGRTHSIVAELYANGLDTTEVNINLYQNNSMERIMLKSKIMTNTELHFEDKVVLSVVTKNILKETNALMEDSEGIVENLRDIEGVEVAILIKEYDDTFRISTRSKRYVDVSEICKVFNGGGHKRAAGCTIDKSLSLNDIKSRLLIEAGNRV